MVRVYDGNESEDRPYKEVETNEQELSRLRAENERLRELLFWQHHASGHFVYGDDGEWQCSECMIDFRRDGIDIIKERTETRNMIRAKQALGEKP